MFNIRKLKVHIAAPQEEYEFIDKVAKLMEKYIQDKEYNVINTLEVTHGKLMNDWGRWNSCPWMDHYWYEVASQMDMKMVEEADVFLHSVRASSWSVLVDRRRKARGINNKWDDFILNIVADFYQMICRTRVDLCHEN